MHYGVQMVSGTGFRYDAPGVVASTFAMTLRIIQAASGDKRRRVRATISRRYAYTNAAAAHTRPWRAATVQVDLHEHSERLGSTLIGTLCANAYRCEPPDEMPRNAILEKGGGEQIFLVTNTRRSRLDLQAS